MGGKKYKLSVYLIKSSYLEDENIIPKLDEMTSYQIEDDIGVLGTLYIKTGYTSIPKWADLFSDLFSPQDIGLLTQSARAILIADVEGNKLCLTFGHAHFLIDPLAIIRNFGLKVALNIGGESSLRAVDKTSLDVVEIQTKEQSSKEVGINNFGFDFETDILKSITAKNEEGSETLSGRDAVSISSEVSLATMREFLNDLLIKYESDAYKEKFTWVDNISQERDKVVIGQLENLLIQKVNAHDHCVWLAIPEIILWEEVSGFAYKKRKNPVTSPDIHLERWYSQIVEQDDNIDVDYLKQKKIHLYDVDGGLYKSWTVYHCLNAEIDLDGRKFILNDTCWYEIAFDFVTEVSNYFEAIEESTVVLPAHDMKKESDYNEYVADNDPESFCLMDRKFIPIGGGRNKIEFCDLFTADKKLIHVKKYGASSVLSHLFQQGVVSGELFISADQDFREKVNEKLGDNFKLDDVTVRPNPTEYEICFAIMSDIPGNLHIPFFSKVVMKNAVKRLQNYGYKVTKKKIGS